MKRLLPMLTCLIAAGMSLAIPVAAQEQGDPTMQILAEKVKTDKKLVVATNLKLTEEEGRAFWPVYDDYQAELAQVYRRISELVSDYAAASNSGTLSDQAAAKLIRDWINVEADEMNTRNAYIRKWARILPPTKLMRYLLIESKIRALVRFNLSEAVPLVY